MFDGNLFFDYNSNLNYDFVRSGMVNLLNGHLVYFGNRGYGWSSIARVYSSLTTANAYGLDFYTSGIRPSYDQNYRFRGFPVRCLVILV